MPRGTSNSRSLCDLVSASINWPERMRQCWVTGSTPFRGKAARATGCPRGRRPGTQGGSAARGQSLRPAPGLCRGRQARSDPRPGSSPGGRGPAGQGRTPRLPGPERPPVGAHILGPAGENEIALQGEAQIRPQPARDAAARCHAAEVHLADELRHRQRREPCVQPLGRAVLFDPARRAWVASVAWRAYSGVPLPATRWFIW